MQSTTDEFADYLNDTNCGVLEGNGRQDFDKVRQQTKPEGLEAQVQCRFCGTGVGIVLEWPELYTIASNGPGKSLLLPPNWQYSNNNKSVFFQTNCHKCANPGFAVHVTPDEAARHVKTALQMGLLQPQVAAHLDQQIKAARSGR
jgi:ribosomal protein S27E